MRISWLPLLVISIGCGGSKPPPPVAPPPAPYVAPLPPPPPPPAMLDEATVIAKSHAFFEATDRNDIAAFTAMVGPSFILFDQARTYNAAYLTLSMQGRIDRQAPPRSRKWKEEHVYRGPNTAVFVGFAVESIAAAGESKGAEWEGYHTLVWTHDGTDWKASHAQWQPGGLDAERSMWNEAYRKSVGFKQTANQLLVDTIKGRKPGTALDVAMGQGRNAVFLATKGWRTTGVDISDEGIRMAKEAAAKKGVQLTTVLADNEKYDYGTAKWDLVTMIYAGNDPVIIERIQRGLKKNGLFVVEFFYRGTTAGTGIGGFGDGELAAMFPAGGWKILKDEVVEDVADWGLRKVKLVRFVAQKLDAPPPAK